MKFATAALAALVALAAAAERQPLERYQSIVDRQMFGALPSDFDPSKLPSDVQKSSKSAKELTAEQEKLRSAIHFSVINVKSDGRVEVGFTDNSDPKEPRHYFICEGDTAGGWTVEEADHETATMTISKDGVSLELKLGDNSAKGGGNMKRRDDTASSGTGARNSPLLNTGSFISSRRRREQQEAERAAEDRKRREDDEKRRAAEQEAEEQREAERAAEREEQRKQLLAIQEELRRVREAKAAKEGEGADNAAE